MKKRIPYVIFLVSLLSLTVLCGCDKSTKSAQEKQEKTENQEQVTKEETDRKKNNTINLYYLNAQEDGFKKVSCKLQHSDDPKEMANEVLYKLSDTENNNTNKYKASIFDGVVINDVNVIRGKATIDFGAGYIQLSHTQEVLLRTSVVKSLLQIQGIDGVLFSVNGSSLLDNDKMPVGLMEASTILTDDGQADIYSAKKKVKIYYTNETGDKLIPYLTELTVTDNVPLETQVLLALKNPPASKKNLKSPLPSDFYVNQTQILNNICYVDLSSEVEKAAVNVKEKVTVYAMVNSLTDLDTAYQVQFTIDGKKISKLNEFENFDALLTSDFSLCK